MTQNINIKNDKIDRALKILKINKETIEVIMKDNSIETDNNVILSIGPDYCSTYYGTISIKDF
jgi:hypothetical protein